MEFFKNLIKDLRKNSDFARKFLLGLSGAIFGILITYYLYPLQPYRIGLIDTPSIFKKVVIYKMDKIYPNFDIIKDRLYVFKLPYETPYYKKGTLFIKYAKCVAGDRLEVKGLNFYCNGKLIAVAKKTDSKGIPVTHFEYNGTIPDGYFFAYAPHPRSYDSRYWGLVPIKNVVGEGILELGDWK